jgi:hypothetical protein
MKFLSPLWNTFTNDKLLAKDRQKLGYLLHNVVSMGLSMAQKYFVARLLGLQFSVIATITAFASCSAVLPHE